MLKVAPTVADYRAAWEAERQNEYPVIDAFEARCGFAIPRGRLEGAARVLACPVKKNPPNWQHGRVLYALTRKYLEDKRNQFIRVLDIGTAKGFSALCLQWALWDSNSCAWCITSVDVIDPKARISRNTVAECEGLLTVAQILYPWREARGIMFEQSTGLDWLIAHQERIHIAFIDGSHNGETVLQEGRLLADRQELGDLAIFDDVDRPDIAQAVSQLSDAYRFDVLEVLPNRAYAIGVRR